MKKLLILTAAIFFIQSTINNRQSSVQAQQQPRSVVSTSGDSYSVTGVKYKYAVGEAFISKYKVTGVVMRQGFQQPATKKGSTCIADFSFNTDTINVGDTVNFKNLSSSTATAWYWTFGDGNVSDKQMPNHIYNKIGFYNVCLSVLDTVGNCTADTCKEIIIGSLPCKADYSFTVNNSTNTISLIDKSQGYSYSSYWTFGDEYTSTNKNPKHSYTEVGTYPIGLAIYDSASGCHNYYEELIKVGTVPCVADFSYYTDPTTGKVSFSDKSTGSITNWFWNFGDGSYSFIQEPENTFAQGVYKVSLTAGDNTANCMNSIEKEIQIGTFDCKANFTSYVDSTTNTAYFRSHVTGSTSTLKWEFGDGSFSDEEKPIKKYTKPGYYYVSLSTYDSVSNCMDYYSDVILISHVGSDCEAKFTYNTIENGKVQFKDKSKGHNLSSYTWDFGDGTILTDENPQHDYKKEGYFNVCLTVDDITSNCKNTHCEYIKADATKKGCKANFVYTVDKTTKTIKCFDRSLGSVDKWIWNFGDGTTKGVANPTHTYTDAGYYRVYVKINSSTDKKCRTHQVKYININEVNKGLKATFAYDTDTTGNSKGVYPTDFTGASYGDAASFSWNFGDGNTNSTTISPTHEYTAPGTYNVCFSVYDANKTESDSICEDVIIKSIAGINDLTNSNTQISVYPNPSNGTFTLVVSDKVKGISSQLSITDIQGRTIHNQSITQVKTELDVSNIPNGIYYLRVNTDNDIVTMKIVVLK